MLTALRGKVDLRSAIVHFPQIIIDVTDGPLVDKPVDKRTRNFAGEQHQFVSRARYADKFKIAVNNSPFNAALALPDCSH